MPTRPRNPKENGKQERSGGYVKSNALQGPALRQSLDAQNAFLRHWNRTMARLRIHGTTRRQVWTHFVEVERAALQPLAAEPFPFFTTGERTVHTDGHVEVGGALLSRAARACSASASACAGTRTWSASSTATRWSPSTPASPPGVFAPRAGEAEASTRQQAYVDRLVGQCGRVGPALQQWAEAALAARGVRAIRLIQGVLGLTRRHPRERVLAAVTEAHARQHFRYQTIRQLVERTPARPAPTLATDRPGHSPDDPVHLGGLPAMNAQLTARLRHLRLSGMVEALPAASPRPKPRRCPTSSFSSCSSRTSSPAAPTGSSRAA